MEFDAAQRREILREFSRREKYKVARWEKEADTGDGTLRHFLSGKTNVLSDNIYQALAVAATRRLNRPVSMAELKGDLTDGANEYPQKSGVRNIDHDLQIPHTSEMARDVPVYGTISGRAGGLRMGNDQALDWVRRPPRFNERRDTPKDIFAVMVEDVSMVPRYGPGDLLYIDPLRAAQIGDCVVVEIQEDAAHQKRAILRVLAVRTEREVTLEQYSPPARFVLKLEHVLNMYRVMTTNDLLGA